MDGDDQARRAEPALHRARVEERLLHGMEVVTLGETLDGDDRRAVRLPGGHQAGAHEDVVHQDRARTALTLLAGVLRTPQLEALAQDVEQALAPQTSSTSWSRPLTVSWSLIGSPRRAAPHPPEAARGSTASACRR